MIDQRMIQAGEIIGQAKLSRKQLQAYLLKHVDGWRFKEIARHMGVSLDRARTLVGGSEMKIRVATIASLKPAPVPEEPKMKVVLAPKQKPVAKTKAPKVAKVVLADLALPKTQPLIQIKILHPYLSLAKYKQESKAEKEAY